MRVLFLDIDGVLNSEDAKKWEWTNEARMEEPLCRELDRIVEATKPLYVVLSSAWRLYLPLAQRVADRFVVFDRTDFMAGRPRGDEVQAWLDENKFDRQYSQLESYAILDDNDDFLPGQPLFLTDPAVGLTREVADAVIEHLMNPLPLLDEQIEFPEEPKVPLTEKAH